MKHKKPKNKDLEMEEVDAIGTDFVELFAKRFNDVFCVKLIWCLFILSLYVTFKFVDFINQICVLIV